MMIHVLSQVRAENLPLRAFEKPYAFISITSDKPAKLTQNRNCKGILRLVFIDVDKNEDQFKDYLFNNEMAKSVWKFCDETLPVDNLYVHCEAGISRSSATAAAIYECLSGGNPEFFFKTYYPNRLVYRKLLETFGKTNIIIPEKTFPEEIDLKNIF